MVEMPIHEVVRVIAVRNRFMPAAGPVPVRGFVTFARVSTPTFRRIRGIHLQFMLIHMIAMHIVHMAIVKETLMPLVDERGMAALIPVLMRVSLMNFMTHVLALLCSAMLHRLLWQQEKCGRNCWLKCGETPHRDLLGLSVAVGTSGQPEMAVPRGFALCP